MMDYPFSLALILPLFLAGGWRAFLQRPECWSPVNGLARIGYAWIKWTLSRQLHYVFLLGVDAAPEAANGWSAFIGMVAFASMLCLALTAMADLLIGAALLFRLPLPEIAREPFWANGFVDFWNRWGAWSVKNTETVRSALIRCGLFSLGLAIGMEAHWGLALWLALQVGVILMDSWLGRRRWWKNKVPHGVKSVLVILLFTLSMPLLYGGSPEAAMKQWELLFNPPAATMYSLFLDVRLTHPRVLCLLWLGVLTLLVFPRFAWWMERGRYLRGLAKAAAIIPCALATVIFVSFVVPTSDVFPRRIGRYRLRFWEPDDFYGVVQGQNGGLYSILELDRLTLKRDVPSRTEKNILQLQKQLQAAGAHLLVIPVPGKISLQPEPILSAKYQGAVYPPGYHDSLKRLKEAGVDVLDMTDKLLDRRNLMPLYFEQDSHWRWEAMKELTVQVSRHIRQKYPQVVKDETPLVDAVFMERHDVGDLARWLTPPESESFWQAESTQMVGLRGLTGADDSPVLVVGGSLIQVYDSSSLSFAPASETDAPAGFPTQLGALLGRGLEVVDERDFPEVEKKAVGKKLVIWVMPAGRL